MGMWIQHFVSCDFTFELLGVETHTNTCFSHQCLDRTGT